jgi:hypothetical protein
MIHVTIPPLDTHTEAMRLLGLRSDPQSAALAAGLRALDKVTKDTELQDERDTLQRCLDLQEMIDRKMLSDIEDARMWRERTAEIDRQLGKKSI